MEGKKMTDKEMDDKVLAEAKAQFEKFYKERQTGNVETSEKNTAVANPAIPETVNMPANTLNFKHEELEKQMSTETNPDLLMSYELVELPSKGLFYPNGLDKIKIEYLTSKDEDLLTTPSFIEDGTVIDKLLSRKIVDKSINPNTLLNGDRSALILFLRASSYGHIYKVNVPDPRNGKTIEADVDLRELKYKEITKKPDSNMEFSVELPMRKKVAKFRLLNSGEEAKILKNAEERQQAYGTEYSEYNTIRLKAMVTEIDGNRDRAFIDKFIDVMPAGDAFAIRREYLNVSPDIDMNYKFKTKDGYEFVAPLSMGVDFFFPSL
jgi:hypothetical protein